MKTKTILKTLAVALLMPAMLLTTACSSDDNIIDSEKSANTQKGYALPVTVNVTRQGDEGTRATYTDNGNGTGSLAFSTGDKLFVQANNSPAGKFAGLLDYNSEKGKFSGTIMTQNAYSGTADALLAATSSPFAALVPAGYGNYNFFTIYGEGTYNASLSASMSKTFALTKKDAVEQFSHETATSYSSGFALAPKNGIASFTISGLTASTEVTVVFSDGFNNITKNVMTNASGVATFAVGMSDEANFNDYTLTVDGNNIALPTKTVEAGHIYNISRSAAPAVPALNGKFSVSATKKVNFSKGNLQATYNGTDWTWAFAANQWDYIGNAEGNTKVSASTPFVSGYSGSSTTVDLFGWVGASSTWMDVAQYGITSSSATNNTNGYGNNASEALKSDWGNTIGSGWRTLTSDEWQWMLGPYSVTPNPGTNCRTSSTIGGVANARWVKAVVHSTKGLIIYPDALTWNDATMGTAPTTSNTANNDFTYNTLTDAQWSALEAAGCVFLPAAGFRSQATVAQAGSRGGYWSSSPNSESYAYRVYFISGNLNPAFGSNRYGGNSVRLVRDVQ